MPLSSGSVKGYDAEAIDVAKPRRVIRRHCEMPYTPPLNQSGYRDSSDDTTHEEDGEDADHDISDVPVGLRRGISSDRRESDECGLVRTVMCPCGARHATPYSRRPNQVTNDDSAIASRIVR